MPIHDLGRLGRTRDNLRILLNAADGISRSIVLKKMIEINRQKSIKTAVGSFESELTKLNETLKNYGESSVEIISHIHKDFDESIMALGLTEKQEDQLQMIFERGYDRLQRLHREEEKIINSFSGFLDTIYDIK